MEFLVITGMSGAGKSQAMKVVEDMNYYCMDNLPPSMLGKFAELCFESRRDITKVAVVVDIRSGQFFEDLFQGLEELSDKGITSRILFLDASDKVLIKRYKELRRPHPLNPDGSIIDGIASERQLLETVKSQANYIIDTSNLTLAVLKDEIKNIFIEGKTARNISIVVNSFGFKHGTLLDGDLIFDVRFIPNPFYIPELKEYTGNDDNVKEYVFKWAQTTTFVSKLIDMLEFLIPNYIREGKSQLIIGIGCTGGVHRSVAIANKVGEILKDNGHRVTINHRDYKLK